jgi:hypothetical protein
MSSRPIGLSTAQVSAARVVSGAPVGADPALWTDANLPPAPDPKSGGAIDTQGCETIWLGVETSGGTAGSVTITPLVRDGGAPDGQRWKPLLLGGVPQSATLSGAGLVEVRVDGRVIFPCLTAVAGAPTSVTILAMPGRRMPGAAAD